MNQINISTVTPVYSGAKYLKQLVEAMSEVKSNWEVEFPGLVLKEAIFVVDNCIDDSETVLKACSETFPWVNVIVLSKNYGQHPATIAGILHASGDWIITLDEDLQHHPKNIATLLQKVSENGDDICYALSDSSIHSSFVRDKATKYFKKIIGYLIGDSNVKYFSSFRCLRGSVARAAASVSGPDSYFDITLSWFSNSVTHAFVDLVDLRNNQTDEKSGYSIFSLLAHAKRMVMSTKLKFLRLILVLGVFSFFFSVVYSVFVFVKFYFYGMSDLAVKGWPSTIISIYFFGGLSCLFLGIIIENISDLVLRMKGKPTFFSVDRDGDEYLKSILNK